MGVVKFLQNDESRHKQKSSLASHFENLEATHLTVIWQICRNSHEEVCCEKFIP